MHALNYRGNYISVDGPLNISRSRQGRPVIFQAGTSPEFMDIASKHIDSVSSGFEEVEDAKAFSKELKKRVSLEGRSPNDFVIMSGHNPIVGRTEKEADQIQHWYESGAMNGLLIRQELPSGFDDFIDLVVPILQEKGVFRKEYESNTLRGNLGLPYP